MLNVVCVNHGNYLGRGVEYVNNLYRGVARNSSVPIQFIVFTDLLSGGYLPGIQQRILPATIKGWYNKLYLFKPGLFPQGERVLFLDLDTLVVGNIDAMMQLQDPEFVILRDFMQKGMWGPGVMMWVAGMWPAIWTEYEKRGCPTNLEMGDLTWINYLFSQADYTPTALQDIAKGVFSYKVDCKAGLPADARLVCFHGLPRPHQVSDDWVKRVWCEESAKETA